MKDSSPLLCLHSNDLFRGKKRNCENWERKWWFSLHRSGIWFNAQSVMIHSHLCSGMWFIAQSVMIYSLHRSGIWFNAQWWFKVFIALVCGLLLSQWLFTVFIALVCNLMLSFSNQKRWYVISGTYCFVNTKKKKKRVTCLTFYNVPMFWYVFWYLICLPNKGRVIWFEYFISWVCISVLRAETSFTLEIILKICEYENSVRVDRGSMIRNFGLSTLLGFAHNPN